jgi:hypothetical protein
MNEKQLFLISISIIIGFLIVACAIIIVTDTTSNPIQNNNTTNSSINTTQNTTSIPNNNNNQVNTNTQHDSDYDSGDEDYVDGHKVDKTGDTSTYTDDNGENHYWFSGKWYTQEQVDNGENPI